MKLKIYDIVKTYLELYPEYRDSDKKLTWAVFKYAGCLSNDGQYITYSNFMDAPSFESIRRSRQKVQELHPELRGSKFVQEKRQEKAEDKGTFIFRETIGVQEKFA